MTRIYLVRHGETDWNIQERIQGREDIPLNENGIRQAAECAEMLLDCGLTAVLTSPLRRALVTAQTIAKTLLLGEAIVTERLIERDFGAISGLTPGERKLRKESGLESGAEPIEVVRARGIEAMNQIAESYPDQNVGAVSHGALINAVLSVVSGGEIGTGKTVLFNGGISLLYGDKNGWTVQYYNKVLHVPTVTADIFRE